MFPATSRNPKRKRKQRSSARCRSASRPNGRRRNNSASPSRRQSWKLARKRSRIRKVPPPRPSPRKSPLKPRRLRRQQHVGPAKLRKRARPLLTAPFIANSSLTARGAKRPSTVSSGNRAKPRNRVVGGRTPKDAGFIRTLAGPGSLTSHLAGPPIITGVGRGCVASAGSGFPVKNGRRPGFPGEQATTMSAGRPCRPKRASIVAAASIIGPTTITRSAPISTLSCAEATSVQRRSGAPSYRPNATSPS